MKKVSAFFLVIISMFVLASCSMLGGGNEFGEYKLVEASAGGVTLKEGTEIWEASFGEETPTITLMEGGKFKMSAEGDETEGTYTSQGGGKLTLTAEGQSIDATVEGGTLTLSMEQSGMEMSMKFVKK